MNVNTDPKTLWPSGSGALRKPRLANAPKIPKIGVKPKMVALHPLLFRPNGGL